MWDELRSAPRWFKIAVGAVLGVTPLLIIASNLKADQDYAAALQRYRTQMATVAHERAEGVEFRILQIYQGLRTISLLPSVRRIDRHGRNLSNDDKAAIQQVYNNLEGNVDVSEVYIVPKDLDPDALDPVTGKPQAPILMFDQLLLDATRNARNARSQPEADAPEEVEIYEYREFKRQFAWLRNRLPNMSKVRGLDVPMLSSPELITCDNSIFVTTGDDADRKGVIFSVPFFGIDGRLRGSVAAIVRTRALASFLPKSDYALINRAHGVFVGGLGGGQEIASKTFAENGRQDPSLFYSGVFPLGTANMDGAWELWAGAPRSEFLGSPDVHAITMFRLTCWFMIALGAALATSGALIALQRHQARVREAESLRNWALEQNALKLAAETANVEKSKFLASMSHELRTPLNAIIGYSEIILEDPGSDSSATDIQRVLSAAQRLLTMINDLLDFSKIEADKIEPLISVFEPCRLVQEATDVIRPQVIAKGLRLTVDCDPGLGEARSDAFRLGQCLLNLLSNAVKFTSEGEIRVACRAEVVAGVSWLAFEVADTGIGMTHEQMDRLFKPFTQADASISFQYGGTGLGLAISKRLAQILGGDVSAASTPGRGSIFTMRVPRDFDHTSPAESDGRPVVVVIEDEPNARDLVMRALERAGFAVRMAGTAREGAQLIATLAPVAVVLDIHLPEEPGWLVLEALKEKPDAPPVLVFSSDEHRARALALGARDYLVKPADRTQIANAVLRLAAARANAA